MSASNYAENNILNYFFTTNALTSTNARPTAWYVSLHTADPGETGSTGEVSTSSTGYARATVAFGSPSSGTISNSGTVTFATSTASWGTITYVGIWDASSGGNCLWSGPHNPASQSIPSGSTYTIASGQLTISLD